MAKCALCKQEKELQLSHIIPNFIIKWLKETSATGFMRDGLNPENRAQDLPKFKLLCHDCELRFSQYELYFYKEIFRPFVNTPKRLFNYDNRLLKFAVSISWRQLVVSGSNFKNEQVASLHIESINRTEETWRNYLLDSMATPFPNEHHILFLEPVTSAINMPTDFQWYTLRTIDATLIASSKKAIVYTKFPGIMLISAINPITLDGWVNTRINETGEIACNQIIKDEAFHKFLINRFYWIQAKMDHSAEIEPRILKAALKNPDKALESKSFEVSLIEAKRERTNRVKNLHPAIQSLIEITELMPTDQNVPHKFRIHLRVDAHLIAEKLSRVNEWDELKIAYLMETTIRKAKATGEDSKFVFEGDNLTIIFMINLYEEQEDRGRLVCSELSEAIKRRHSGNEKGDFLIISWNPSEPSFEYICKCYVDIERFKE